MRDADGKFINVTKPAVAGVKYKCPCCRYKTLSGRGEDDICPVCFWQDDGQDNHDADDIRGGPNYTLSLTQARENYKRIGAAEERVLKHVRPPNDDEKEGSC